MIYICSCGCHEDEYEKGEIVPLLDEDMFNSTLCWFCHEEQSDRAEEAEALNELSPDAYEARATLSDIAF